MFDSGMVDSAIGDRAMGVIAGSLRGLVGLAAGGLGAAPASVVEEHLVAVARVRAWLDGIEARLASRAGELAAEGSGAGVTGSLVVAAGCSPARARRVAARAATLEAAPELGQGLAGGALSGEHVDALGRAARQLPGERRDALFEQSGDLARAASGMGVDAFARHVEGVAARLAADEGESRLADQKRATALRCWPDRHSGMIKVVGQLDPELGARWLAGIAAETDRLAGDGWARDHRTTAHAAVELITRGRARGPAEVINELVLVADADTVTAGRHDQSLCETEHGTALPPETLRRLTCSAAIAAIIHDATGVPIWAGVSTRVANRAQRRALRSMYRTCAWHRCDRPFDWCQIHHIIPWQRGGPTHLANLIPLCWEHHHQVHEGRWHIDLTADRTLTITRPDGQPHTTQPLPSLPPTRDKHTQLHRDHQLARDRLTQLATTPTPNPHLTHQSR